MHEIVPHQNTNSADERVKHLQKSIGSELGLLLKKNRHVDLEVVGDTQETTELKKAVRSKFSRCVTFLTTEDCLGEIGKQVVGDSSLYRYHRDALNQSERGVGAVVGNTEPFFSSKNSKFLAPVKFAPPPWHVFDDNMYKNGFTTRADYIDDLELHPYDNENCFVPDRFEIEEIEEVEDADPEDGFQVQHAARFLGECLLEEPGAESLRTKDARKAYSVLADDKGWPLHSSSGDFGSKLKDALGGELENKKPRGGRVYVGLRLSESGRGYLDRFKTTPEC
ncbi:hypothetical protein ACFQE1_00355 [Halobium palmae]|uniref:Uncharacterized protein n=1 Tax=Halobium palmae TaxID=1776492 RepID=A0ABD5RUS3_9EURY